MLLQKIYEWISDQEIEVLDEPNDFRAYAKSFGLGVLKGVLGFFMLWGIGTYVYVIVMRIKGNLNK